MTQIIGDKVSPCSTPLFTWKELVAPNGVLTETSLLLRRLVNKSIMFLGQLILSRDFLMEGMGAESKAFAISKDANQNSLLLALAAFRAELTIVNGSMVLWLGRPAKLNSDKTLFDLRVLVNLLLIIPVNTFLTESTRDIGLVSLSLWLQ